MEKEKKIKVKKKIDWKHEMALAPGYIIVILWVAFTFMLLGWIIAASLSTTTDIFAGKALKFPSGLHFENYVQAWGSGGVATFFTNNFLSPPVTSTSPLSTQINSQKLWLSPSNEKSLMYSK